MAVGLDDLLPGDHIRATVEDELLEVVIEGGAVSEEHERIEIAGAQSTEEPTEIEVGVARER